MSALPVWQTLPLQHPGHDVWSHTQLPLRQRWPVPHAAPEPHWHTPPVEQLSATWLSHGAQATPGAPQAKVDSDVHVLPAQHPCGHDVASQTHCPAAEQCSPAAHAPFAPHLHDPSDPQLLAESLSQAKHVEPAVPHMASDLAWHVDPLQQPVGQDVASQTH